RRDRRGDLARRAPGSLGVVVQHRAAALQRDLVTPVADRLWVEARPLRFWGVETGMRMTVVRLADGGLFVHSPVPLDEGTRAAVDALGAVKAIIAPSLFHHLSVGEWMRTYPAAIACACPGLERKRRDVGWH